MLKLSIPAKYAMARAAAEAKTDTNTDNVHVEHLFLGLLKLAEMSPEKFSSSGASHMEKIKKEIEKVAAIFSEYDIHTREKRSIIRRLTTT